MLDLVILLALSAPVPKPKAAVRPPLAGEWRLTWGEGGGRAEFRRDGTYRYAWRGTHYYGEWRLEGDVLHLLDGPEGSEPAEHRVTLEPGRWRGKSPTWLDAPFRLEAVTPPAGARR